MGGCPAAARIAWRMGGLLGLFMVGCMPLGYAYPKVSFIPPGTVGPVHDEVHAFRVDITNDDNSIGMTEKDMYVLSRVPLHDDGSFDPQTKVSVDYGWLLYGFMDFFDASTHHTMLVRLYRPGYHTLEIESWQTKGRLHWVKAPTLEEQEQAIDDLVSTWKTTPERIQIKAASSGFTPPHDPIVFHYLAPGSDSPEHWDALGFAASEYERLLSLAKDPDLHARLQAKTKALREMALK
jgi:hypothetical protein